MLSQAAIELLAMWAVAASCWKSFFLSLNIKKKRKDLSKIPFWL